MPTDHGALLGRTIAGKFVVEDLVGVGGMGAVYRAQQLGLDRPVALKVLHREMAESREYVARFKREAQAASRLEHAHSVRVIDFGHDESGPDPVLYIAMEYVEGPTLQAIVSAEGPLDARRIAHLMSQVLTALGVAHDMGVIHRDLKPENIIIMRAPGDDGQTTEVVKVCDFGIAAVRTYDQPEGGVTLKGVLMGTPAYMSPEQARGEVLDARTDLYSAGVVLYHLLAGRTPFTADTPLGIALRHITDEPPPPSLYAPVNEKLQAICLTALSKERDKRFASAWQMRAALRQAAGLASEASEPRPPDGARRSSSFSRGLATEIVRRPRVGGGAITAGVVALVALGGLAYIGSRGVAPAEHVLPPSAPLVVEPAPAPAPVLPPPVVVAAEPPSVAAEAPAAAAEAPAATAEPAARELVPAKPAPRKLARVSHRVRTPPSEEASAPAAKPAATLPAPELAAPPPPPVPVAVAPPPRAAPATPPPHAAPATPPPRPAAPTRPPAPRPPLDPARASVSILDVKTSSAVPAANLRVAFSHLPLAACYRDALRAFGARAEGTAALDIRIDVNGTVRAASVSGVEFLPSMKGCLERAARSARIRDIDTGEASAVITLRFSAGT